MSTNSYVYVGAYLLEPNVPCQKEVRTPVCSKRCGAKVSSDTRFCGSCGAPVETLVSHIDEMKNLSCHDLPAEFEDMFWTPESGYRKDCTIWLPNRGGCGETFDQGDDGSTEMPDNFVVSMREKMLEKYGKTIQALESEFQVKVKVLVGVFSYYN